MGIKIFVLLESLKHACVVIASCQALRKGEWEGKESLVATVYACADFSAILRNPDTCLYMSATLNVIGQSILLLKMLVLSFSP